VKARIERTNLGDVSQYIRQVYHEENAFLIIKLDMEAIKNLQVCLKEEIRHRKGEKKSISFFFPCYFHSSFFLFPLSLSDPLFFFQLEIDTHSVLRAILATPKTKMKKEHIIVTGPDTLQINPFEKKREKLLYSLHYLKDLLPKVVVKGCYFPFHSFSEQRVETG
jgi:hypothetical protein